MSISPLNKCKAQNKTANRKAYLDFLRIIACVAVVFVHVISNLLRTSSNDHFTSQLLSFGSSIRWCVPVFFMISGALMLEENKQYNWNQIIGKIISRVIKPYLVWSVIYQVIYCLQSASLTNVATAPIKIIIGYGWYHLWYLYALIGVYISIPCLAAIWKSKCGKSIAVIGSLIMVTVNTFNMLFPEYICRMFIPVFSGYVVYIVFGAFINSIESKKILVYLSFIGCSVIIILSILIGYLPEYRDQLWDYNNILICLCSAGVVALIKLIFSYTKVSGNSSLCEISKYTFGIYLCHDLFLQLNQYILRPDSLIMAIVYGVVTIILSCIFVLIIMKNHVFRKLLL